MVASYNLHSPEEIEKRRDFLMANLPDSQLTHEFMEDQEAPENHEQLGDKITEMVYQRMPLAVLKLKNNHFLLQPTYVNSYAVAMFGYEMEEGICSPTNIMFLISSLFLVFAKSDQLFLMRALHPDCWTNLALAICTAVVNKHEVFQVKTVGRHKDGSYFDLIAVHCFGFFSLPWFYLNLLSTDRSTRLVCLVAHPLGRDRLPPEGLTFTQKKKKKKKKKIYPNSHYHRQYKVHF